MIFSTASPSRLSLSASTTEHPLSDLGRSIPSAWPLLFSGLLNFAVSASLIVAFYAIRLLVFDGREYSSPLAHPFAAFVFGAVFAIAFPLTATVADPDLERLALKALVDSLAVARISGKEAAILLGLPESHWSEICRGQRHLPSINRLLNLPWPFWQAFLPSLAYVLTKKKVRELVMDERRTA